MTTYRKIHGRAIKSVSSNLSAPSAEGQIWFNTTDNKFRSVVSLDAWISSGILPSTRQNAEGCGTQTAGLASSGATSPSGPDFLNTSCEYNGTGWSSTTTKNTPGVIAEAVFGTQTAAVAAGGYNNSGSTVNTVEEYNGSSWTAQNTLPAAQRSGMGCGAENSGLVAGGEAATVLTNTQEYDGTNWTAGGAIPAATYNAGAGGTSESNSWFAGGGDSFKSATLIYDGSSWTASGNINTARDQLGGAGISTAALIFGGRTPPNSTSDVTEKFDGSSWTTSPATLGTAAKQSAAFGTKTAAVYAGNDPAANITQEYNSSATVITAASWSSGGSLNSARRGSCSGGDKTAAYYAGGIESSASAKTETYDGTSFSEVNNMGTARYGIDTNMGTLTAGLTAGGKGGGTVYGNTEEWDGTNWSEQTDMSSARRYLGGFGTQTAGVVFGGRTAPNAKVATTEEYNGSSWTSGGDMNTVREYAAGCGTLTAGLTLAGAPGAITDVEYYNGTAWSEQSAAFPGQRDLFGISGTQTNALIFGGGTPSNTATAFSYDGTAFATSPSMGTARQAMGSPGPAGTSTSAIAIAGYTSTNVGTTEEFTGDTTSLNVKDLTQS